MELYIFHEDLEIGNEKNKPDRPNLYAHHMQRIKAKKV